MKRPKSLCPLTQSPANREAANQLTAAIQGNFPRGVPQPALRALATAGFTTLEELTKTSEADLLALHGMGQKALGVLREALNARGLEFRA